MLKDKMGVEKIPPVCKYYIICGRYSSNCKPEDCEIYKSIDPQITERELIKANIDKMFLEDMCEF